jgi:hypothetical protein
VEGIKKFFSTIWNAWKKVGEFIGNVIGRVFLMLFYISVVLPFGLALRLFGDPLRMGSKYKVPSWVVREANDVTLEASYNQY